MVELNPPSTSLVVELSVIELVKSAQYEEALRVIHSENFEMTPLLIQNEAKCYLKTNKVTKALESLKRAEEKGWLLPDILMLKGQCLYKLQEWETSLIAFEAADKIASTAETKQWITRCQAHIEVENSPNAPNVFNFQPPIISDVKKEWYQNAQIVTIRLFIKDVKEKELKVSFLPNSVNVYITRQRPISYHLNLPHEINTSESYFVLNSSSIELKMEKVQHITWENCEV
ncbi:CS domain containing protein [Trichomonas vaginalis G3]|uniref:CS domain containing protein n=1 Tax=Trichomonas vaginalis (strain ATCC PRA-98 / G3) TaxID=412133 RepID=A2E8A6_TRIV3|nr:SGT1-like protein family [Trichomonas vaginalis G3]EAY11124.1 CS domain containing protein [Trichomonas vaginalis G3]KAI5492574.1 SGT1-like protein family [Trichomonas vaginalis G3]|eukprot:XP_001323347.1 CS domain containing protein [Trichomonas vaginalis G3]